MRSLHFAMAALLLGTFPLVLSGCDGCTPTDANDPGTIAVSEGDKDASPQNQPDDDAKGHNANPSRVVGDTQRKEPKDTYESSREMLPEPGATLVREQTLRDGTIERWNVIVDAGGNEIRHGKLEAYYEDGTLAEEATYENGQLTGVRLLYSLDGDLELEEHYKGGKLTERREMDPAFGGEVLQHFKDEQPHGLYRVIGPNGELEEEGHYIDGEKDGKWTTYYNDGTPAHVTHFKLGVKHGEEIEYDADGQVTVRLLWENGEQR